MLQPKWVLGISYTCLALQSGKLRSRFRDALTAGEVHNLDLPEGSLRARAGLHIPVQCFNVRCSFLGPSTCQVLLSAHMKSSWGEIETFHLHTAFHFSELVSYPEGTAPYYNLEVENPCPEACAWSTRGFKTF